MLNYIELRDAILNPWSDNKRIMLIANCGKNSAIKIRQDIETEILKEGKKLPQSSPIAVPTKRVLDYLGLEEKYIFEMAEEQEKKSSNGGNKYAGL